MLRAGFRPIDPDFPVFRHPMTGEEYALARRETNTAAGYRGFAVETHRQISLEQDLSRRDLTINAIAQDVTGRLIDPYQGQQDLADRQLRHVTPAFAEDPVRVLRTARFAAKLGHLGFAVVPETLGLMQQMVASAGHDLALPLERIGYEMQRALASDQPWHFFALLAQIGLRPVTEIPDVQHTVALLALRRACALTDDPGIRFVAYALLAPQLEPWCSIQARRTARLLVQARRAWSQLIRLSVHTSDGVWLLLQQLRAWHPDGLYAAVMQALQAQQRYGVLLTRLQAAQVAAAQVQADTFRAQGIQGAALGQALQAGRQAAIVSAWCC
jgi:tRNA nucleotidyltransferase (CCA-adding enzyme)